MTGASPVDLRVGLMPGKEPMGKVQSAVWRDIFDPGWREREAALVAKFLALIPERCGCQPGTCQSKPDGCRMREEIKPGSGEQ